MKGGGRLGEIIKGTLVAAIVAALVTTAEVTATTSASERAQTHGSKVTISSRVPAFSGNVRSGYEPCVSRRRVELFRRAGGSGRKLLGRDRSSSSGGWAIEVGNLKSGAYYARAKPLNAGSRGGSGICTVARSEVAIVD